MTLALRIAILLIYSGYLYAGESNGVLLASLQEDMLADITYMESVKNQNINEQVLCEANSGLAKTVISSLMTESIVYSKAVYWVESKKSLAPKSCKGTRNNGCNIR